MKYDVFCTYPDNHAGDPPLLASLTLPDDAPDPGTHGLMCMACHELYLGETPPVCAGVPEPVVEPDPPPEAPPNE